MLTRRNLLLANVVALALVAWMLVVLVVWMMIWAASSAFAQDPYVYEPQVYQPYSYESHTYQPHTYQSYRHRVLTPHEPYRQRPQTYMDQGESIIDDRGNAWLRSGETLFGDRTCQRAGDAVICN